MMGKETMRLNRLRPIAVAILMTASVAASCFGQPASRFIHLMIGAGVDGQIAPSFVDNANSLIRPVESDRLGKVGTMPDFTIGAEYQVAPRWAVGLEYGIVFTSRSAKGDIGSTDFSYEIHLPTALVHYVVPGKGYALAFGGGLGWHFASVRQMWTGLPGSARSTGNGPAIKLDASVGVPVSQAIAVTAGVEFRGDLIGDLKMANGNAPTPSGRAVGLNFTSFGLRLGLQYTLR